MNAKQNIKMLLMALVAVNMLSACIIETSKPLVGAVIPTGPQATESETHG